MVLKWSLINELYGLDRRVSYTELTIDQRIYKRKELKLRIEKLGHKINTLK